MGMFAHPRLKRYCLKRVRAFHGCVLVFGFSPVLVGCAAFANTLDFPASKSARVDSLPAPSQSVVSSGTAVSPISLHHELIDWQRVQQPVASGQNAKSKIKHAETLLTQSDHANDKDAPKGLINMQLMDAPVGQVLLDLAHDAGLSLALHQHIEGTVTVLSQNQTLATVLAQLAMQIPLHWEIDQGMLHLWGDKPYVASYAVDYLNMDRSTRSRVGLATQVGTINASLESSGVGSSNSSQTALENSADHHFWGSLAIDLDSLIGQSANAVQARYTINRDAGMVTLNAPASLHQNLKNYLHMLNANAQRQVLIEATVVEVALSENFQAGVDWQLMSESANGVSAAQILSGSPTVNAESVSRIPAPNGLLSLVQKTDVGTITGTLNLLEQFGDVRILSKPRIIALNNQTSVLKVVDNRVYFTVNVERQRSETKDEIITETEIHTVPVGLVMNVTPHIDKGGEVMLNVRPTLSRILGFVDDPNPELVSADVRNSVPEIQVREMESMLRVQSGQVAIIGGLMQETQDDSDRALPGLSRIPLIGALFRQQRKTREQSELLIVLKPTVLPAELPTESPTEIPTGMTKESRHRAEHN